MTCIDLVFVIDNHCNSGGTRCAYHVDSVQGFGYDKSIVLEFCFLLLADFGNIQGIDHFDTDYFVNNFLAGNYSEVIAIGCDLDNSVNILVTGFESCSGVWQWTLVAQDFRLV